MHLRHPDGLVPVGRGRGGRGPTGDLEAPGIFASRFRFATSSGNPAPMRPMRAGTSKPEGLLGVSSRPHHTARHLPGGSVASVRRDMLRLPEDDEFRYRSKGVSKSSLGSARIRPAIGDCGRGAPGARGRRDPVTGPAGSGRSRQEYRPTVLQESAEERGSGRAGAPTLRQNENAF
jgi:hypothetical protein